MKKIIFLLALLTGLQACKKQNSFLDGQAIALDENMVFTDSIRTMAFLTGIYSDIAFSFNKGRWDSHGNTEQATDDAEYTLSGVAQIAVILYNGSISPTTYDTRGIVGDFWNTPYTNIRRVNLLLSKLSSTPLSASLQERVKGEALFLRAWYYTQLLIAYGGVPVVGDKVYGKDDIINLPRETFANTVKSITDDLDKAAALLPAIYPNDIDYGRVTKGACQALKSRALLYAASPLFNGGCIIPGHQAEALVSYPAANTSYWQAAADAANAVIGSGTYSLMVDNTTKPGYGFYNMFLQRVNPEYIFGYYRAPNRDFEGYYNPRTRGGSSNRSLPTQDLVDCFPMKNGLQPFNADGTINAASGYSATNPYVNRDPRFNNSIIYNGSSYFNATGGLSPVYTFVNGTGTIPAPVATQDAFDVGTTTGYFSRKMCDSMISANSSANTNRAWPLIRYAEILLNYAEAINEAGQTALAYPKLIELRQRAGIDPGANNMYGLKENMTKEEMRAVVRNERRIELAFEDHRWHDIRRWKIAMVTNNQYNKVMKITKNSNATYTYERRESIRRHNFRPEMYLMPIPSAEINKMPAMLQNPGW
ncbi:RagB/SusD family nutrient uptake outer membrane protein [Lacibacter luteus]|uniref:RagB/SusD family nutrient uptake outer membrane protein n=1 Tax=Lacibacter luteus TaxID=2508719 RepID=A0A4Q1CMF9_9BACT|nr:RagB/SusD family nutrient uptake outer membrane protein [Lacibacter luteus]RXK62247.1 RagB/SusD family nutrient uptake outer membrane protein [Lacibacter luteus]